MKKTPQPLSCRPPQKKSGIATSLQATCRLSHRRYVFVYRPGVSLRASFSIAALAFAVFGSIASSRRTSATAFAAGYASWSGYGNVDISGRGGALHRLSSCK